MKYNVTEIPIWKINLKLNRCWFFCSSSVSIFILSTILIIDVNTVIYFLILWVGAHHFGESKLQFAPIVWMINGGNYWTLWSLIVQNCIVYKMVFRSECVIQMVLFDFYQPLFIDIDGDPYRQNELLIILGEESPDKYHKNNLASDYYWLHFIAKRWVNSN